MRELVKVFKALSDETRLRILNLLLERECCVCEVMQALEISQTRASRNLSALFEAGLVRQRREGRWTLYSIEPTRMEQHLAEIVAAVSKGLAEEEVLDLDRERLQRSERVGPGCLARSGR